MADKPKADPPNGMENYDLGGDGDLGALSTEQQQKLNQFKVNRTGIIARLFKTGLFIYAMLCLL